MIHAIMASLPTAGPLGLDPVIVHIYGSFALRWYQLAYLFGIIIAYVYLLKLIAQPGAPMAKRHAEDLVFYATLGVIIGGRLGYVLFYGWDTIESPLDIFKLWEGGMSFHGGVVGVSLGILYLAWRNKLNWLRVHDYVACCIPPGLFLGRLANFVNGELWGAPSTLPWAVVFPPEVTVARHPSQLYEAFLEGIVLFLVLMYAFWKTDARYQPGKLVGIFTLGYGLARFAVEFIREPDSQLREFAEMTGLHMGQWLSLPMILIGLYLIVTAKSRRQRVEPIAGDSSVA